MIKSVSLLCKHITFIIAIFCLPEIVLAQIPIPNSSPVVEDFDAIGTGTALPANWLMSAAGITANWTTGTNVTTLSQQACGATPTAGGRYNWGVSATCTDRAVGFMTSGSYASPNTILAQYQNTSGSVISDISFSFDVERYRINTNSFSLTFFTSTDGSTWTSQPSGDIATGVFATGASSYTFASPQSVTKTVTLTGINLAAGASFYVRWIFTNTGSSNSQGLGIDNVSLTPTVNCTMPAEPTIQSSAIAFSNITTTTMQLNWTRGNGTNCIVIARANTAVTTLSIDGTSYIASSVFGSGSNLGAGQYVVYNSTGNSIVLSGLAPNTTYYFSIHEYNVSGACTNYLTSTTTTGNTNTLAPTSYNFYRGNIHSHTAYSDGDIDGVCSTFGSAATCCYTIANGSANFDFMGIADHNHNEGPVMTLAKYQSGVSEAANFNIANAGSFSALYGMEWGTISAGGHTCVYGIDSLVGWNASNYDIFVAKGDYNALFNLIAGTPNAFAYLAHPNATDFGNIFAGPYNSVYDSAIVGISMENGPYNSVSTTYNDPPTGAPDEARFKDLLKLGYHVGPGADQDNHNSNTMGRSSQLRTVILATALSKSTVIDAYFNMRFYASEDYNTEVDYKINGAYVMGSRVSSTPDPTISVSITDPDGGDIVSSIEIYYGVPGSGVAATLLTSNSNSSTLSYTHPIATASTYYYYAKITQSDGHRMWTSPIWYTKGVVLPISLLCFDATAQDDHVKTAWATAMEINNHKFVVEKTVDGNAFDVVGIIDGAGNSNRQINYELNDYMPYSGRSYYRLRQIDFNGNVSYSNFATVQIGHTGNEAVKIYPNPTSGIIHVVFNQAMKNLNVSLINSLGENIIKLFNESLDKGVVVSVNASEFSNGIYYLVISNGSFYKTEKIIKR